MSRFLVTGAAGFIGSHLVERLRTLGHDVVAWDCFTHYYPEREKVANARSFDVERVDLSTDPLPVAGYDGIFHLAGQPGVRSFGPVFTEYVQHNILASQRLFEAARASCVRVLFASTSSVYGEAASYPTAEETAPQPISPYGVTKLACEHLAHAYGRNFGLDYIVVRYFTVYGPRQRPDMAFRRLLDATATDSEFPLYGDGTQSRGFTYIDDVTEATILAFTHGNGIYNIGGGEEASMNNIIASVESISGRRPRVVRHQAASGDVRRTSADTTRIRSLGWAPTIPLVDGLRAQWAWTLERTQATADAR